MVSNEAVKVWKKRGGFGVLELTGGLTAVSTPKIDTRDTVINAGETPRGVDLELSLGFGRAPSDRTVVTLGAC